MNEPTAPMICDVCSGSGKVTPERMPEDLHDILYGELMVVGLLIAIFVALLVLVFFATYTFSYWWHGGTLCR